MRKLAAVALLLALAAAPAAAQMIPRPTTNGPFSMTELRQLLQTKTPARVVVVDSAFAFTGTRTSWPGVLYTKISDAIAYVLTQSPSFSSTAGTPWTIYVMPGATFSSTSGFYNYSESGNLTLPAGVCLQGYGTASTGGTSSPTNMPVVKFTCPSGSCLKLTGASCIDHLALVYNGTPTAAGQLLENNNTGTSSSAAQISNASIQVTPTSTTFVFDALLNTAGSAYLLNSSITMTGGNAGNRALVNVDTVAVRGVTIYGGRMTGATGCSSLIVNNAASGAGFQLFNVRIDPKCTTDLVNVGTGTFNLANTPFTNSSGTIGAYGQEFATGFWYAAGPKMLAGAGAPEGAVTASVGSTWQRTDCTLTTTCFCVKESGTGNTGWVCK